MSAFELRLARTPILFACIVVAFFAFYARLASYDYTAVDGGVRCLDVFSAGRPFILGNNHLLYPIHIYAFNQTLAFCGLTATGATQYFHNSIFLNALAAALCLGFLFVIMLNLGISDKLAMLGVTLLAFSDSFSLNATNPNEPMLGLCLSTIAVWLSQVAWKRRSFFLSWLSGCAFAYAMATYQSMILWLPAIVAVYVYKLWHEKDHRLSFLILLSAIILAFLISTVFIYRSAYETFYHLSSLSQCFVRFMQADGFGNGHWGKLNFLNFPLLLPGLVQAFFHLPFVGVKHTFSQPELARLWIFPFVSVSLLCLLLILVIGRLIKKQDPSTWIWFLLLLFVFFPVICPLFWTVTYSKLWLQPLAAFSVLTAFSLASLNKVVANTVKRQWLIGFVIAFAVLMLAWNEVSALLPNHQRSPEVDTMLQQIDMNVEENALVFTSWDNTGVAFSHFYPRLREMVSLPEVVMALGPARLQNSMDEKIAQAVKEGRHVYFLGLLDIGQADWDACFQKILGVDYQSLEKFRLASSPVVELHSPKQQVKIYMLDPALLNSHSK